MNPPATPHVLAPLVAQLCEAAELEAPAKELIDPVQGPREFLLALDGAEQHVDAIRFLAHLLPRREAVWWAWMCARREAGADATPHVVAALSATERWIATPTDELRRAAFQASEAAMDSGAGCAALAAFLSGNLAPVGQAEVPPPPFGTARAVFGSIVLSAVAREPEKAPERYRRFLKDGLELADRLRLWDALMRAPANPSG